MPSAGECWRACLVAGFGITPPSIAVVALINAVPMALAVLALAWFGVETRHRSLEEIGALGAGHEIAQLAMAEVEQSPGLPFSAANLAKESMRLYAEWARTLVGMGAHEIPVKDPRFADPAWRDNPLYRRLGQGYMAFCEAADRLAEGNPDWRKRERAKFLSGIVTSSLAPTNTLAGNPAALKRLFETEGMSLVAGLKNLVGDIRHNKGMPSQVKASDFKVGENLAAKPKVSLASNG